MKPIHSDILRSVVRLLFYENLSQKLHNLSKISGVVHILVFVHELKFTVACPKDFSCLNEGTCIDGSCSCANGFVGYSCEQGKAIETHLIINIYFYLHDHFRVH